MIIQLLLIILVYRETIKGNPDGKRSVYDVISVLICVCFPLAFSLVMGLMIEKVKVDRIVGEIVISFIFAVFPVYLTFVNIKNFVLLRERNTGTTDDITIIIGGGMWFLLFIFMNIINESRITGTPWYEPVPPYRYHEFLNSAYSNTVFLPVFAGIVSLLILCRAQIDKMPPLLSALLISLVITGLTVFVLIHIQLAPVIIGFGLLFVLYLLNLFLVAARAIKLNIVRQVQKSKERELWIRSRFGTWLNSLMSKFSGMTALSFLLTLPIILVFEVIYIILGQGADGFIKAFTETADWTFSQQTPPPPVDYEGHYLCTVAAGGHRKVVKPLRFGVRRGERIVVNRQLLIANAFEDMIKERFPGFHRSVRSFYDKHGYPISRHITTQLRADIVYILMKPLELIFITALYLFDTEPENRIAVQYSEYKGRIG